MRVLFDHQTFSLQRYGGISRYFANIHHALNNTAEGTSTISTLYSPNHYIQDDPGILGKKLGALLLPTQKKVYKWNKKYSKYQIRKNSFDIFHPTYYDPYFLKYLKKPFVLTVHDMIHEKFPHYFPPGDVLAAHKKACIEKAAHIIAISQATKNDILAYFDIPEDKISVVYHGFQPFSAEKDQLIDIPQQYLLFVGERGLYKNFSGFISAIVPLLKSNTELHVICAGGGDFLPEERTFLDNHGVLAQVKQQSVTDAKLSALYQNAQAFVFPSLYEGFGLPLLEAFKNNCAVVCSNTSCLPEIGGEAAHYFNPKLENDILTAVKQVISDQAYANKLILKGQERLLHFTMEECMLKTKSVYEKVLNR